MTTENTGEEFRSLSLVEAAQALRQSREKPAEAETEEAPTEEVEAEPEAEEVETEDQAENEAEVEEEPELEAEEVQDEDDPEAEEEEDADPEDEDPLFEINGETFTLSEFQEWKKDGLRQADYTKKTQELSEAKKNFEAERQKWEAEREQVVSHLRDKNAQLEEALTTFAIEQDPKPKRADFNSTDEFLEAQDSWNDRQEKKQQARQAYESLKYQQQAEVVQQETAKLLQHFPSWRDPEVAKQEATDMAKVASEFGFSHEELSAISDHRIFRVLGDLVRLRAEAGNRAKNAKTAAKKAKAVKPLSPGAKPNRSRGEKELRSTRERLKKTGSAQDAVAALRAKRKAASRS